jgi:hypothetical protein
VQLAFAVDRQHDRQRARVVDRGLEIGAEQRKVGIACFSSSAIG